MEWLWTLDANILLFLQEHARMPILTEFLQFYTNLGNGGAIAIAVILALLLFPKTRKIGLMAALALILDVLLINVLIKNAVGRVRPYEVIEGLKCITALPSDSSFPSGHTGAVFAVASVLFFQCKRQYGLLAIFLATLMGYSRLYVGVHYPTDVLVGMLVGILAGAAACWILRKRLSTEKTPLS